MNTATVLAERVVVTGPFTRLRLAAVTDDRGEVRVVVHRLTNVRTEFLTTVRPNRLRALARALTALAAELRAKP